MAHWQRMHLPKQETRVPSPIREDPTFHKATTPVCHNYWACTLELGVHTRWAHPWQLLKPTALGPELRNKRSHHNGKPPRTIRQQPREPQPEKRPCSQQDPAQPRIHKAHHLKNAYLTAFSSSPYIQYFYSYTTRDLFISLTKMKIWCFQSTFLIYQTSDSEVMTNTVLIGK